MNSQNPEARRRGGASRREALLFVAGIPAFSLAAAGAAAAQAAKKAAAPAACFDEAALSSPQKSLRRSLSFQAHSTDPAKTCSGCAFFKNPTPTGCGTCQLLNSPVNPDSVCSSWAKKP